MSGEWGLAQVFPDVSPPWPSGEPPTVSVVLATYNGRRYLAEQLESLRTQALRPMEIVIGDDGSTDGTLDLIERFARKSPIPVRLTRHVTRLGYAGNFLATAKRASGELLAFCDQDDVWYDDKLVRVAAAFEHRNVVLVAHHADVVDESGIKLGRTFPVERYSGVFGADLPLRIYPGFSLTARRQLLRLHEYYCAGPEITECGQLSHDTWLWLLAPCVGKTVILGDKLAAYRQHGGNAVGDRYLGVVSRGRNGSSEVLRAGADYNAELGQRLRVLAGLWQEEGYTSWEANAEVVADSWERRSRALSDRAALYALRGRRTGVREWFALVAHGGYAEMGGRCKDGVMKAAKDLVRTLLG